MQNPKFSVGQRLFYKPAAFAPLQVLPGGKCEVLAAKRGEDMLPVYTIRLDHDGSQKEATERDLHTLDQ